MVDKSRVAVLLAAYNGMQWIAEQIDSILNQVDVDVTIFISVDLSTDGTNEWCSKMADMDERIVVLPYGERFGGAAKNFFRLIYDVDFSCFDYVSLADQDDVWLSNKLSHAISTIKEKDLDALSSDVIAFWEDGREKLVKKSYPKKKYDYFFEAAGPGCTYVFRANSLKKFKAFLSQRWEEVNQVDLHDWMIYAFLRYHNMVWFIDDVPLMQYRQHANNQVGFNSGLTAYKKRISMVKEKWYQSEVKKISVLLNVDEPTRWFKIKSFWQLRRRPRDAFALLAMNVLGIY